MDRFRSMYQRHAPGMRRRSMFAFVSALALSSAMGCSGSTGPGERLLTLEVAPQTVACMGMVPTECLQVREVGPGRDRAFAPTFIPIEGFTHEPGYRYVILVARRSVKNPPADGSSIVDRLVEVISRTLVE